MQLAVTTDYAKDTGNPEPYLARIAKAGFSHVHWCHQWNTDFLYSRSETEQIGAWLNEHGLRLLDLHASAGVEKKWSSPREYERLAGVDLVVNRIEMTAALGGDVVVMHTGSPDPAAPQTFWLQLGMSLADIEPFAARYGVRIALENGDWAILRPILEEFSPNYVGLCYDSGHGNLRPDSLGELERLKDRLISIHLHDNDGSGDQHNLMFAGAVPWDRLATIIANSAYSKCVSMEVSMRNAGIADEGPFLAKAYETGVRFSRMIDDARAQSGKAEHGGQP